MNRTIRIALLCAAPAIGLAQSVTPLTATEKLKFHFESSFSPLTLLVNAAYDGYLVAIDSPKEWRLGAAGLGMRFASTTAGSGINATLAVGLDTVLHQDPRYYRSGAGGIWRRTGHAIRGTLLTRTDSGGETISAWRLGSDYGSAFLSNQWYPDRVNTIGLGFEQGTLSVGADLARNIGREFWPDIKRKVFHKK